MQGENEVVPLQTLNNMFGSKENFYWAVWQLGWYLPNQRAPCITVNYLMKVLKGAIYRVKRSDIQLGITTHKNVNKVQLFEELFAIEDIEEWGFDLTHLPDKQFMLDVLHLLRPDNHLFSFRPQDLQDVASIEFPVQLFRDVNTMALPGNFNQALFKKSEEQIKKEKIAQLEGRLLKKQKRANMLQAELQKNQQKARVLQSELGAQNQMQQQ
ncbi:hypothetical protein ABPG72_018366 [Tetrahymena utriculariae]